MTETTTADKFSISKSLEFGWDTVKSHFLFFLGITITASLCSFIPSVLVKLLSLQMNEGLLLILLQALGSIIHFFVLILVSMGTINICLKFTDHKPVVFVDLFRCYQAILNFIVGSFLCSAIVMVGIVLFIVPGIIWAIQFQFFKYAIIDQGLGPIEALKRSSEITKGSRWPLLAFGMLVTLINILGFLCLGIGLFVTIPLTLVATTFVYRQLCNATITTHDQSASPELKLDSTENS